MKNKKNILNTKRIRSLGIIFLITIFLTLFYVFFYPQKKLKLIFCDVGQGDSILINYFWFQILIDTGEDRKVLSCLKANMSPFDKKINFVFLSHPDSDHVGGLNYLLSEYEVENLFVNDYTYFHKNFIQIRNKFQSIFKKMRIINTNSVKNVFFHNLIKVKIISSDGNFQSSFKKKSLNCNNHSTVLLFNLANFLFLSAGDIEAEVEEILVSNDLLRKVDILKVSHHGSNSSSTEKFIDKIQPRISVIQVGANNTYKHPNEEIIERLKEYSLDVYRNDKNGEVGFVFKNNKIFILD